MKTVIFSLLLAAILLRPASGNEEDFARVQSISFVAACRAPYHRTTVTVHASPSLDRLVAVELKTDAGKLSVDPKKLGFATHPQLASVRLTEGVARGGGATLHLYIPFGKPLGEANSRSRVLVLSVKDAKLLGIAIKIPSGEHDYTWEQIAFN